MDFPRIPFAKDKKVFLKTSKSGKNLVDLHLLRSSSLNKPKVKLEGEGNEPVDKVSYGTKKVSINGNSYFKGVSENVWEYMICGYQVCSKWLKDRKGKRFFFDEITTCCKLTKAIEETVKTQKNR